MRARGFLTHRLCKCVSGRQRSGDRAGSGREEGPCGVILISWRERGTESVGINGAKHVPPSLVLCSSPEHLNRFEIAL